MVDFAFVESQNGMMETHFLGGRDIGEKRPEAIVPHGIPIPVPLAALTGAPLRIKLVIRTNQFIIMQRHYHRNFMFFEGVQN